MKIEYGSKKVEKQCTDTKEMNKLFGGDKKSIIGLKSRINQLEAADVIKDIIVIPNLYFHGLKGKMQGIFAIDITNRSSPWRLLLKPLDEDGKEYDPCNIDEIASEVKIVEITEVSKHYE